MKQDIRQLQPTKHPNTYPTPPGNYRSFRTTDGLVICRHCHQVEHFARTCPANLPPSRAPTRYQNQRHNYVPPANSQHPRSSYALNHLPHQYSQRPVDRSPAPRNDTTGYPYSRDAVYTNPSRQPTSSPPITLTTDTKREDQKSQPHKTIIIASFKIMVYWTASVLSPAV